MDQPAISHQLAAFVSTTRSADVPDAVKAHASRAVLDWVGSALAGSLEEPARLAREVVGRLGSSNDSTVFAGRRAAAAGAAFANGVATHILELDDVHKGSTLHAAAPVIPAALAVAEREHASGEAFLLAVTLGYEVAFRIGEAVNPSHYTFWHPTGTVATFGAAVAAGSLLRLDANQMLHALGSAGTQAAGLWEFNVDGAMSKALHPGKAGMNGILAADLARAGFTGASRILEGPRGFMRATTASHDASRVTDALGERWTIAENCYKMHSCCGHTHSAIDVAQEVRRAYGWREEHDVLRAVASVEVETYAPGLAIVGNDRPTSAYQAKFSLAYCVAAALLEGRVGLVQFSDDRFDGRGVRQASIATLLPRIRVRATDELTARYPAAWGTRLTVLLTGGERVVREADYPLGNPENPVSTDALVAKLRELVTPRWGSDVAARAVATVDALPEQGDMADAFAELVPEHVPVHA
ncbi:MAG: MmgE/PrpD family protein [Gemmatimonadaceae bacterium]|nr:MmgE/PrpD family protein [Gemmatimonadaceae bacterium]